jgi:hypothetical protein
MGLKRLVKKVTRPIGKAVKKIVPKELAGIMQVAAPLAGPYAPLVYAAGAYKQSGRINPIALASMALPYVGVAQTGAGRTAGSFGLGNLRYGRFDPSVLGSDIFTARDYLGMRTAGDDTLRGKFDDFLFGKDQTTKQIETESILDPSKTITVDQIEPGTRGILGAEGDFNPIKSKLLTKKGGGLSPTKVATAITMGLSLSQTQAQIEEEGIEDGLSSDEISRLQAEAAEMWKDFDTTAFKPNVKDGGLMRVKLNQGTPKPAGLSLLMGQALGEMEKDEDEILIERDLDKANKPVIVFDSENKKPGLILAFPDESKNMNVRPPQIVPFEDKFIVMRGDGETQVFDSREAAERYLKQIRPFKKGGRVKLREGSEGNELPPDPTAPVNPFKPKPIGPVLPNKAQMVDPDILRQMFLEALKSGEIPPGTDFDTYKDMMMTLMSKTNAKQGGLMRSNFALGTEPTKEESGLGGLPIEADMRYSGGFMPYGAKEKADDVPARLSKNEFVFTADAVRAAGGGSVQKGAQKMYNTMKQLESMGARV